MLEQNSMLRKRKKEKKSGGEEVVHRLPSYITLKMINQQAGQLLISMYTVVAVKAAVGIKHSNGRNNHTPHSIL